VTYIIHHWCIIYVTIMAKDLDKSLLYKALKLLDARMGQKGIGPYSIVVCGGSGLIAMDLVARATKDVDVVALMDADELLGDPDPLPDDLLGSAREIAPVLGLMDDWLNNGPSRGEGGLYRAGLPDGFSSRLKKEAFGANLTVYWVSRRDQIHFKLYAAADRGGYHVSDLKELDPSDEEMEQAARWAMSHDVSEGFRQILVSMLNQLGYEKVAERI